MPESMSLERRNLLAALGAKLELTPASQGMKGAIAKANELKESIPGSVILGQFVNPSNPLAHELTTAQEIWRDTDGAVDVFVGGVGTGGTVSGTGRALKKHKSSVQVVAVEPAGSPVLTEGRSGSHKIGHPGLRRGRRRLFQAARIEGRTSRGHLLGRILLRRPLARPRGELRRQDDRRASSGHGGKIPVHRPVQP